MSDTIDHSVGVEMLIRIGDQIERGQPLMRQFTVEPSRFDADLRSCISVGLAPRSVLLITDRLSNGRFS